MFKCILVRRTKLTSVWSLLVTTVTYTAPSKEKKSPQKNNPVLPASHFFQYISGPFKSLLQLLKKNGLETNLLTFLSDFGKFSHFMWKQQLFYHNYLKGSSKSCRESFIGLYVLSHRHRQLQLQSEQRDQRGNLLNFPTSKVNFAGVERYLNFCLHSHDQSETRCDLK